VSRRARTLLTTAALLLLLVVPVCGEPGASGSAYVQCVLPNSAVVCWAGPGAEELELQVAHPAATVARQLSAPERAEFRVDGLTPGGHSTWELRGPDGGPTRANGVIRTPPLDDRAEFRFALVGDSGGQPWWSSLRRAPVFHALARNGWLSPKGEVARIGAAMAAADPVFWLHAGDVIYPDPLNGSWDAGFFLPFAALGRTSPCFVALGNHDLMGDDGATVLGHFVLPGHERPDGERMYSFGWGPLRVCVLDTNGAFGPEHPSLSWLRAELAAATEPWLVVMGHHPVTSASRQGDRKDLVEHLAPELARAGVDLYFAGHDHTYQRMRLEGGVRQVVSGGGGKSLYDLRDRPGMEAMSSTFHWCKVDVKGASLTLTAIGLDGATLDTFVLDHSVDAGRLERIRAFQPGRAQRIDALLR